jgi:hypothetical protein
MADELHIGTFKTASVASVDVTTPAGNLLTFEMMIHSHDSAETLALSEVEFYQAHGKGITFPHYEIEVVSTTVELTPKTHYMKVDDRRIFVCWPHHTPDLNSAIKVMEGWSAAAVIALTRDVDSNDLIDEYGGPSPAADFLAELLEALKKKFDISVKSLVLR